MAKIDVTEEVLKHPDDEIIEYLYGLASSIHRQYVEVNDPIWLLTACGDVDQLFAILKGLKRRNDSRKSENDL